MYVNLRDHFCIVKPNEKQWSLKSVGFFKFQHGLGCFPEGELHVQVLQKFQHMLLLLLC